MKSFFLNKVVLFPYYVALKFRHLCYDKGIFKSYSFDIPIIIVGNVSAGGTGKTPHTEYLVKHLTEYGQVAVLSRGYGRKSKGFRYVEESDGVLSCGDEPLQIKKKFPGTIVAVDGNRVRGIKMLMDLPDGKRPYVIVMDDAFQHRRVKASRSLVLIDYSNPPFNDNLLPFGTLRDLPDQIYRADAVIISKCPPEVSIEEQFEWKRQLNLTSAQRLFFTSLRYGDAVAVFGNGDKRYIYSNFAQLVTAIANPKHLENELSVNYKIIRRLRFRDHKNFGKRDIAKINSMAQSDSKSVIITTEKDAQRLEGNKFISDIASKKMFYFPIEVSVQNDCGQELVEFVCPGRQS
jgi:tetraacyldisaccharide 4'-kinase